MATPLAALEGARGHLMPFAPVLLGLGIGLYFALPAEPGATARMLLWGLTLLLAALGLSGPEPARLPALAGALLACGVALGATRAAAVAAPVLPGRYHGPVEGRVVAIDRSQGDAIRVTLDRVVLPGRSPQATPERVRIALHGQPPDTLPLAGTVVAITAHLSPPAPPVEPGGFDFRRLAWFERLGAVGYSRTPLVELAPPEPGPGLALTRLRMRLSRALRERLPGEPGGFVAAVLTGDRSGVGTDTTEALRNANLAHLLAISGLHMGLLTAAAFAAVRGGLALVPPLALRLPLRRIAAMAALVAGACYLGLSGGSYATQRAFVMVAVMLLAVMAGRRALSLRAVAVSAVVVLVWQPEALASAGFQMSFAATTALVAVFAALREPAGGTPDALAPASGGTARHRRRPSRLLRRLRDLFLCSLVAGLATAPIAAAQFHRLSDYGLIANLVSVPVMGAVVMPAALAAAALWPLGLEGIALRAMELGARWILAVAHAVGGLEGAVRPAQAPAAWALPVLASGALWLILWPGRARLVGLAVMAAGAAGWSAPRPAVLIAADGALVGVTTPDGRALSRPSGAAQAARGWLSADGDAATPAEAAARPGWQPVAGGTAIDLPGGRLVHLTGRDAAGAVARHCRDATVIVLPADAGGLPVGPCSIWDRRALARTGAVALPLPLGAGRARTVAEVAGRRPWTRG